MSNSIFKLEGKVVLITGAGGIQGPEHVKLLKQAGAEVVATDIKNADIILDVTDEQSIKKVIVEVIKKYGRIDVLINNAGGISNSDPTRSTDFEGQDLDGWEKIIRLNLTSVFLCCQAVGAIMVKQKAGSIINVSSIYGLVAPDFRLYEKTSGRVKVGTPAAFTAAKAGLIGLTKYLASYWADKGIRVNCVTPGGIFDNQSENFVKKYSDKTMLGRMAEKNEVSGAILYLASDLSSYVTGENIIIDGGLTTKA